MGNVIDELRKQINAHLDEKVYTRSGGLRQDINSEFTQNQISMFVDAATPFINRDVNDETLLNAVGIPPTQNIYSRFFLAVGDEVYENRRLILDQFKAMPNGNKYFNILMKSLAWFERQNEDRSKPMTPNYQRYPQTVEEAENYFLLKPKDGVSKDQKTPSSQSILENST